MDTNQFLIELQAILNGEVSKGNINKSITRLQNQIEKLKIQATLDPKTIFKLTKEIEKVINKPIAISNIDIDASQAVKGAQKAGEQIANASNSSTAAVIQNEERKRQAYQETADAQKKASKSLIKNNNIKKDFDSSDNSAEDALKHYKNELKNTEDASIALSERFDSSKLNSFTVNIKHANGEVESLKYNLNEVSKAFEYAGGSTNNPDALKQFDNITKYRNYFKNLTTKMSGTTFEKDVSMAGFKQSIEDFKDGKISLNELKTAYNEARNASNAFLKSLNSQVSSQNQITQTKNNMRDLPSMLDGLETDINGLKDKSNMADISVEQLRGTYERLQSQMSANSGNIPLTEEWITDFHTLMSAVKAAEKQVKALEKIEASDNSQVTKQKQYYSDILANYKQAYDLKRKLLTAGEEETKEIEKQLATLREKRKATFDEIKNQGLADKNWQNAVKTSLTAHAASYRIDAARQNDKTNAKKEADDARNAAKANREANAAKKNQEAARQKEVNALLAKQKTAYEEIWNINKQIASLNPDKNDGEISALNEKKKLCQDTYLATQKELQAYDNLTMSQEHINSLLEIRKKAEADIAISAARQGENTANDIQDKMNAGRYKGDVETLIAKTRLFTDENGRAAISTDTLSSAMNELTAASDAYANNRTEGTQKRLIAAADKLDTEYKKVSNTYRTMNAELIKDAQRLNQVNSMQTWINNNTKALRKYGTDIAGIIEKMGDLNQSMSRADFTKLVNEFKKIQNAARSTGNIGMTFADKIKKAWSKFGDWSIAATSMTFLTTQVRQALSDLKEVDTLLTEISKANDRLSKSDLDRIGDEAFDIASKYGKKATDFLSGVQEMSRAGYDNADSMAELSTAAQGAGDMTADLANKYIIATDKAYKLGGSVEKLTAVLDGSNFITNHNAVNMTELAEGMSIVGSQAASLGVSVDETTAVIGTMVATTQQSGSEMARAFKAILLNLQQVTDEEEGIDAEGLTKYEKACKALNVSLKETKNGVTSLRSPMEVIKDLAAEYSKLAPNDIRRTNLLSSVGGKLRANALNAILENYDMYSKMLEEYAQGTGSMAAEAEKTAKSWEGSLNRLKNTWDATVENVANSDAITAIINGFNGLLSIVNKFTDAVGSFGSIGVLSGLFMNMTGIGERTMFHCGELYCAHLSKAA